MKCFLTCCATFLVLSAWGQRDETIFSDVDRVGGFGGPIFEFSSLNGDDVSTTTGGGGALILDDFFLGGYGIGTFSFSEPIESANTLRNTRFSHGGFWIGYTPYQHKAFHPFSSVKLGWGNIDLEEVRLDDPSVVLLELEDSDNIFVVTPELGVEVNVFAFFRLSVTASYRWVTGVNQLPTYDNDDFSGFGGTLTLRFGGFGGDWDW